MFSALALNLPSPQPLCPVCDGSPLPLTAGTLPVAHNGSPWGEGIFLAEVGRAFRVWQTANSRVQNFEPGPSWVSYGYTAHVEEWSPGG